MANIIVAKGSSEAIGKRIGVKVKDTLETTIHDLMHSLDTLYGMKEACLNHGASKWFSMLDAAYQEEFVALSESSGVDLDKITKSYYFDCAMGCSSFVAPQSKGLIIGRNNDFILPKAWGHITKIYKEDKIPLALIGLEGSLFGSTGYNAEKLWIHSHYIPSDTRSIQAMSSFVFVRKALEEASTIKEVDLLLNEVPIDGSMFLLVADGKSQDAVVFEVHNDRHETYPYRGFPLFFTNHSFKDKKANENSKARYERLRQCLRYMPLDTLEAMKILGDDFIEQRSPESHTVYACVVDLVTFTMRFAYDDAFAASQGTFKSYALDFND